MTVPPPGSILRRNDPREPDALCIENRSDRVWIYGFVRMAPGMLFVGGVIGMGILTSAGPPIPLPLAFVAGIAVVAIPLALDRSTLLDPVDYVLLGREWVHVKRLAGRRNRPVTGVRRVELRSPDGEDYDERQTVRRYAEVTIRFAGLRAPARLLVSTREAGLVADWAARAGVALVRTDSAA